MGGLSEAGVEALQKRLEQAITDVVAEHDAYADPWDRGYLMAMRFALQALDQAVGRG